MAWLCSLITHWNIIYTFFPVKHLINTLWDTNIVCTWIGLVCKVWHYVGCLQVFACRSAGFSSWESRMRQALSDGILGFGYCLIVHFTWIACASISTFCCKFYFQQTNQQLGKWSWSACFDCSMSLLTMIALPSAVCCVTASFVSALVTVRFAITTCMHMIYLCWQRMKKFACWCCRTGVFSGVGGKHLRVCDFAVVYVHLYMCKFWIRQKVWNHQFNVAVI